MYFFFCCYFSCLALILRFCKSHKILHVFLLFSAVRNPSTDHHPARVTDESIRILQINRTKFGSARKGRIIVVTRIYQIVLACSAVRRRITSLRSRRDISIPFIAFKRIDKLYIYYIMRVRLSYIIPKIRQLRVVWSVAVVTFAVDAVVDDDRTKCALVFLYFTHCTVDLHHYATSCFELFTSPCTS